MKFRRLLMPMIIMGVMFTMSSMVFGQANVTCGLANATTASVGPVTATAAPGAAAVPATPISVINAIQLQGPSTNASATGHTEVPSSGPQSIPSATASVLAPTPAGGTVRVVCYNNGAGATVGVVVLVVTFGAPITNTQTFPGAAAGAGLASATGIRVINGSGVFVTAAPNCTSAPTGGCPGANVGIGSVGNTAGQVVIGLGTPVAVSSTIGTQNPNTGIVFGAGSVSTFDLDGVLLSTNGKSGEIDAVLTELSGNVNIGVGTLAVITNVQKPLTDPVVPSSLGTAVAAAANAAAACASCIAGGPAVLNNAGGAVKNNFTVKVAGNYSDLFKSSFQFNGGGAGTFPGGGGSSTQVNFIFKNVPSGLSISGCLATFTDPTGSTVAQGSTSVSATNVTSAAPVLTVSFTGNNAGTSPDTTVTTPNALWLTCTNVGVGSATLPLPSTPVSVQAEMGPTGTAFSSAGLPLTSLSTTIPRYQDTPQPTNPITVIVFPPSQTTLLITYAVVVPGFNTGIAVANTTTDVFGAAGGGATPTAGTVLFTMYPNSGGAALTFTSPSVASGTVFANNLSSMLPSGTTSFSGYMFAQANFPNAHGAATIYDTNSGHAALSTPVLVVNNGGQPITSANPRNPVESLGQ